MIAKHRIVHLASLLVGLLLAAVHVNAQDDQAQTVLNQARAALGTANLKSLSVSLTERRTLQGPQGQVHEMKNGLEFSFLLPDKSLKTTTLSPPPGGSATAKITEVLNGDQHWMSHSMVLDENAPRLGPTSIAAPGVGAGGPFGGTAMIASGGRTASGARTTGGPSKLQAAMKAAMLQERRAEFAHYLLAFLLTGPAEFPLEWSYAGKGEADGFAVDVIEVKGPDDFAAQLSLDEKTHLPRLLSYEGQGGEIGFAIAAEPAPQGEATPSHVFSGEFSSSGATAKMQMHFADYRSVNGAQFPHRLTITADGRTEAEWEGFTWQPNANLSPEQFQPHKK
jgi:hypothetical protein